MTRKGPAKLCPPLPNGVPETALIRKHSASLMACALLAALTLLALFCTLPSS